MDNRIVKSENQYHGPVFDVESLSVNLPDGRMRKYDLVTIQDAVTILPLDAEGYVHFVRQYRIGANKEMLELPAGKIETGEEALATAEREIREEIGMAAGKMQELGRFYVSPGYSTEYMYTYLATELYPSPLAPDQDEFLNVVKLSLDEVMQMVRKGELDDSKSLAALFQALPYLKNWTLR